MMRRTMLLSSMREQEPALLEGYTRLKYIRCTGEQFVFFYLMLNQDSVITMNVQNPEGCLLHIMSTQARNMMLRVIPPKIIQSLGNANLYIPDYPKNINSSVDVITLSKYGMDVNGSHYDFSGTVGEFVANGFSIFGSMGYNWGNSGSIYGATVVTYGATHKLVPALSPEYGAGLYDLLTNSFYACYVGELEYELID